MSQWKSLMRQQVIERHRSHIEPLTAVASGRPTARMALSRRNWCRAAVALAVTGVAAGGITVPATAVTGVPTTIVLTKPTPSELTGYEDTTIRGRVLANGAGVADVRVALEWRAVGSAEPFSRIDLVTTGKAGYFTRLLTPRASAEIRASVVATTATSRDTRYLASTSRSYVITHDSGNPPPNTFTTTVLAPPNPAEVQPGEPVALRGRVLHNAMGVVGMTVVIETRPIGSTGAYTRVTLLKTGAAGYFNHSFAPNASAEYRARSADTYVAWVGKEWVGNELVGSRSKTLSAIVTS